MSSRVPAFRTTLCHLVCHILSHSILFQEDPFEPNLWLRALPIFRPAAHILLPRESDIIDLTDECKYVITFLDECVQRCLQTPYRYVEALQSLAAASSKGDGFGHLGRVHEFPSPLLMTLLEQLDAKVKNKSLTPACLVGIVTFIGSLIFYLSSKIKDLGILKAYADKIDAVLSQNPFSDLQSEPARMVEIAIQKKLNILRRALMFETCEQSDEMGWNKELQVWLDQIEDDPIRTRSPVFLSV